MQNTFFVLAKHSRSTDDKIIQSFSEKTVFYIKTKGKFNLQYIVGKSTLYTTKITIQAVFYLSYNIKTLTKNKTMLHDREVARTFFRGVPFLAVSPSQLRSGKICLIQNL